MPTYPARAEAMPTLLYRWSAKVCCLSPPCHEPPCTNSTMGDRGRGNAPPDGMYTSNRCFGCVLTAASVEPGSAEPALWAELAGRAGLAPSAYTTSRQACKPAEKVASIPRHGQVFKETYHLVAALGGSEWFHFQVASKESCQAEQRNAGKPFALQLVETTPRDVLSDFNEHSKYLPLPQIAEVMC